MIKFNKQQRDFLRTEINLDTIPTDPKDIDRVLSKLALLFANKGLKKNSEPNDFGLLVDDIIGLFNKELQGERGYKK